MEPRDGMLASLPWAICFLSFFLLSEGLYVCMEYSVVSTN